MIQNIFPVFPGNSALKLSIFPEFNLYSDSFRVRLCDNLPNTHKSYALSQMQTFTLILEICLIPPTVRRKSFDGHSSFGVPDKRSSYRSDYLRIAAKFRFSD